MIVRVAALLILAIVAQGCANRPRAARVENRRAVVTEKFETFDSPSLQFLPRQREVPGWQLGQDPLVVPGDQLARYLEGDAEHFKLYDVVDVTAGIYGRTDAPGFATVQIFRFPDFIKSFGAYSTRREGVIAFLTIPNESFAGKHSVHIWRGPFYVRLIGGGSPQAVTGLKELAAAVAERMPTASSKPAVLGFFPEQNRVPNSESFSIGRVFGQPYFVNAFTASFVVDGQPVEGMILPASNKEAAEALLRRYQSFFVSNGKLLDSIPNLGENNFTAEDRYLGRTVAFRIDRFLIVFRGYGERQRILDLAIAADQRILGTIRRQLVAADERAENRTED